MKLTDLKVIVGLLLTIGGVGYAFANTFVTVDDLQLVAAQAAVGIEAEIKTNMKELALLETKPNKTPYDLARIKYLQEEIERLLKLKRS